MGIHSEPYVKRETNILSLEEVSHEVGVHGEMIKAIREKVSDMLQSGPQSRRTSDIFHLCHSII